MHHRKGKKSQLLTHPHHRHQFKHHKQTHTHHHSQHIPQQQKTQDHTLPKATRRSLTQLRTNSPS